ncbi:MAG: tyrosine-type recombinase/integrase [Planctomycetota bacterium]|jgi:integrase
MPVNVSNKKKTPKWNKTKYPGVRYREYKKLKGKAKKYYAIRYTIDGRQREEGLGWSNQGWNAKKASIVLAELKKAIITGEGQRTLAERRKKIIEEAKKENVRKEREKLKKLTFAEFFLKSYLPVAETNKKVDTIRKEKEHFKNWIMPVIGNLPLQSIAPLNIERLKKNMLDAGRSPRTIQYVFATIRQCWNLAKRDGIVTSESPTILVKLIKFDNKRFRFLTREEADSLLNELKTRSLQTYRIALISLYCGARADEIFKLKWKDINTEEGTLTLWDTKNTKTRTAYMTQEVIDMFSKVDRGSNGELVFPNRNGSKINKVSNAFFKAVKKLGFNNGVTDRREKVVFHTLRHTYASWHAQCGTDLFKLKELMGLSSIALVERYAHLAPGHLQEATKNFEKSIQKDTSKVIPIKNR